MTQERANATLFFSFPLIFIDPVDLPGLSAIGRKCLFGLGGVWGYLPDGKPYKYGSAVDEFVVIEVATSILEFADAGNTERANIWGCEIQVPLVCGWVEPA